MSDIIQLLPESVANQIAAGEVVQRPSSVVKELVENAIDANATEIIISIVDSGRTIIQVTDNGKGMTEFDARMAFERHATSKIRNAEDIFAITSMGFRGEALASIAAVSQTELRTRQIDAEVGTKIVIKASEVESQEPFACPIGSTFTVKNLFYNIPARRKFLKSNQTEFKYILQEIFQVAIAHPNVAFTIYKDDEIYAKYPAVNLKQRIVSVLGKRFEKSLLQIEGETSIVKIWGFIGTPEIARKNIFEQYFFVNNRFFRQKSYQGAVMRAYQNLLPAKDYPPFFVFFEIDPSQIDVNIHPTKTEIKFIEEYNICQLLEASIKHALGKNNIVPSMDFLDIEDNSDIFAISQNTEIKAPSFSLNPNYNPFSSEKVQQPRFQQEHKADVTNWESLFEQQSSETPIVQHTFKSAVNTENQNDEVDKVSCMQIQKKYILTTGKTGIMLIDIKRAHSRILYEKFIKNLTNSSVPIQKTLLPIRFETNYTETEILKEILPQLQNLGFDIEEFGQNSFVVNGAPADIELSRVEDILQNFISDFYEIHTEFSDNIKDIVAITMAKSSSIYRNPIMKQEEMQIFIAQLFQCSNYSLSADGKVALVMFDYSELFKKFN